MICTFISIKVQLPGDPEGRCAAQLAACRCCRAQHNTSSTWQQRLVVESAEHRAATGLQAYWGTAALHIQKYWLFFWHVWPAGQQYPGHWPSTHLPLSSAGQVLPSPPHWV